MDWTGAADWVRSSRSATMGTRDPRVDAYIAKAADFAKPVLRRLRDAVHSACPDVEETMKWSFPHFMYKGMLCSMASFKSHAAFGFWKGSLILGKSAKNAEAMGQLGRLTTVSDLPTKAVLAGYIKKAVALNDAGVKVPRVPKRAAPKAPAVPADLAAALKHSTKAKAAFAAFTPSHQREYVEWISEAKSSDTRARRLQTAVEWITEGKPRHWKYM
jgi:uncharacterized protein YdeI (YjbR/CyaY-like superfamily)